MPISINWDDESQTILRAIFWNEWEFEEYAIIHEQAMQMINSVLHTVYVIVDMRTGSFVPKGNLSHLFRTSLDNLPENIGIIVSVNDDAIQRHMFNTYSAFYYALRRRVKRRLFMVETLQAAYDLIDKHRAT